MPGQTNTEPHYGAQTVAMPLRSNVPDEPRGASPRICPYCGAACWDLGFVLPGRLFPAGYTLACTACALRRSRHQRVMDAGRFARECAECPF